MSDTTDRILTEARGPILIVTINRAEARNAVNQAMALQICDAMDRLDSDPSLFMGVITGAGGHFSAGADLKAAAQGERTRTARGGFGAFVKPSTKPLIAAVEGFAVGGGMELCLACDLIVASRAARLGLPETRHNVVAVGGGLFRLPRRLPYHLAMELALTGELREAEFFHRHGLVNRLAEPGEALDEALKLADRILENGPTGLFAVKAIVSGSRDWTEAESWARQEPIAAIPLASEDRAEGLRAFAEKRRPRWIGR